MNNRTATFRRAIQFDAFDFEGYATPHFVVAEQRIRENYTEFAHCFPECEVCYAMKANSEQRVLEILGDVGSSFEVASIYELELLKELGIGFERIVYGSAVKPLRDIETFFGCGVDRFALDNRSELEKIAAVAPGARVMARLRVDDRASVFQFSEKFGADEATVAQLLRIAAERNLLPYGISFHVGSQAKDLSAWARGVGQARIAIEALQRWGIRIGVLNIGGGFPCEYADDESELPLAAIAAQVYSEINKLPYEVQIVAEPGRRLVGDSAVVVSTVIGISERRDLPWLFLDVGPYNGLFEAMPFQGRTLYRMKNLRSAAGGAYREFAIAGPTGDSVDVISRSTLLPADTRIGDRIVIENVGAYSLVLSSSFNGFPKPAVLYI